MARPFLILFNASSSPMLCRLSILVSQRNTNVIYFLQIRSQVRTSERVASQLERLGSGTIGPATCFVPVSVEEAKFLCEERLELKYTIDVEIEIGVKKILKLVWHF